MISLLGRHYALALRARAEQERAHRRRHAHADRGHVGLDEVHRVVYAHAGGNRTAGRIDVQADVFIRILGFEIYELRDDYVRAHVVDLAVKKDYTVFEHAGVKVIRALAAVRLFDDHGHKIVSYILVGDLLNV